MLTREYVAQVAVKEIDTSEKISKALVEIVESLGRWNKYIELFVESQRVSEIASHLFSQIINFLVRARLFYQKPRASKTPHSLTAGIQLIFDSKFDTPRLASPHMRGNLRA